MPFLLILTLFIGAQALYAFQLLSSGYLVLQAWAIASLAFFAAAVIGLVRFFRSRSRDQSSALSFLMGGLIAVGVPPLFYFPFGLPSLIFHSGAIEWIGFIISWLTLLSILSGILFGRWNWKIHRVELAFDDLPKELDGLKIVQISDVHVGSFGKHFAKVEGAIERLNALKPDYVLFTGDLVNNKSGEMDNWKGIFSKIEARLGKFSILGNHDYGDYVQWRSAEDKEKNLQQLIHIHREIGFTPLLNRNVPLSEDENGAYLIGVENWGTGFKQKGELSKAMEGVHPESFKLLMSHDPSHFDAQVLDTDIDLTLSGHTHGMQFGIERFGIRFSPVQWRYPRWAGLYQVGKQYLYVNRGFGFLGFPGRVGIYPEITEIVLRKKN